MGGKDCSAPALSPANVEIQIVLGVEGLIFGRLERLPRRFQAVMKSPTAHRSQYPQTWASEAVRRRLEGSSRATMVHIFWEWLCGENGELRSVEDRGDESSGGHVLVV